MTPTASAPFLDLFVRPPGDLFYSLVVFALAQVGLFMALGQRLRRPKERVVHQYVWATLGMVGAWSALLIGALAALITGQPAALFLPPLERAAHAITLLLIVWAFTTADDGEWSALPTWTILIGLAVIGVGYIITGLEWAAVFSSAPAASPPQFNLTAAAGTWAFNCTLLAALGVGLLIGYVRRLHDAPLKLIACVVLLLGFGVSVVQMSGGTLPGNDAGAARLGFAAGLIFLPAVLYRIVIGTLESEVELARGMIGKVPVVPTTTRLNPTEPLAGTEPPFPSIPQQMAAMGAERESAQLMKALGLMLEQTGPDVIPERIVSAALSSLKADIGALLVVQDANYADVAIGIDRTMNRELSGTINLDDQPTLQNAIERRVQRPLYLDRNYDELHDLYTRFGISQIGPVYLQPLVNERELLAILLIGLPYAGRELIESEQALLKGIGIIAASLLRLSYSARDARMQAENRLIQDLVQGVTAPGPAADALASVRVELDSSRGQIAALNAEVTALRDALDAERAKVADALSDSAEGQTISQRIAALTDEHQHMIEERDRLSTRLRDAETTLATATAGVSATDENAQLFKTMLEVVNREKGELIVQRDRLQRELAELRGTASAPVPHALREMVDRMSAEKSRVEAERAELSARLTDIEAQLNALGVSGGTAGLALLLGSLYEQRSALQAHYDALKAEYDRVTAAGAERTPDERQREDEREAQLRKIQSDLIRLAADRDAAARKYAKLRAERDEFIARQDALRLTQQEAIDRAAALEAALQRQQGEERTLRGQIETLTAERSQIIRDRDRLRAERQALEMERDGLLARAEGDRERLAQLGVDGVGALTRMIDELTGQRSTLETQLAETRTQIAALEDRIGLLQLRGGGQPQIVYRPDNPEQFVSMIHELRTPMTSIVGYVDLLLNESAGILGEMQRKFLQRVSTNVTRLGTMLEDLIRLTFLDSGRFALERAPVDLIGVIEEAITHSHVQFREKGLTLQLDLDEELPPVIADPDAMQQVIGQLLTNAYLVSPVGSDITITAQRADPAALNGHAPGGDAVLVRVADQGGGIPPEDLPRVFARKYKAENPLVPGLGDTGVGLALAKALIEAQHGTVWVETEKGVGSAFAFLLPLPDLSSDGEQA